MDARLQWFMHDGASARISQRVRDVTNHTYHNKWIDTAGPFAWPPSSPDLNPLYFYLWGHL